MRSFWIDIMLPAGGHARIVRADPRRRRPLPGPQVAANDDPIPVDADACAMAIALIGDAGQGALAIASAKALDAFWGGDMAQCRVWTRAGRAIDTHFAAQCAAHRRGDLREMLATLAL